MSQRGTVTIANAAVRIVEAETRRESIILVNNGAFDVYIGADSSVTADTSSNGGIKILADGSLTEDAGGRRMWLGDYWGISNTATASSVSFWQRLL